MAQGDCGSESSCTPPKPSSDLSSLLQKAQHLRRIFEAKPTEYVVDLRHTSSKSTRRPGFYDLHLDEGLRLKKVVLSDNFLEVLSTLCDQHLQILGSENTKIFQDPPVAYDLWGKSRKVVDVLSEESITKDYRRRSAFACLPIASTLAFRLKKWDDVFEWHETYMAGVHGLCDAFLTIASKNLPALPQEQKEDIQLLKKHMLDSFVLWEFKSLVAADFDVMTEIVRLASGQGEFTWMTCNSVHSGTRLRCGVKKHITTKGCVSVTGRKTGPGGPLTLNHHHAGFFPRSYRGHRINAVLGIPPPPISLSQPPHQTPALLVDGDEGRVATMPPGQNQASTHHEPNKGE
ncbi:hypothetical protein BDZ97DRAFT_1926581 [Flammula alnicola]|nr:hypothetical protein BDZ97DRAFT_1926581 [Flammula alnicola]